MLKTGVRTTTTSLLMSNLDLLRSFSCVRLLVRAGKRARPLGDQIHRGQVVSRVLLLMVIIDEVINKRAMTGFYYLCILYGTLTNFIVSDYYIDNAVYLFQQQSF